MCAHLHKSIDSKNGEIRLWLGVVHQIQVDKLLQLQVVGLHAIDNIGKQSAMNKRQRFPQSLADMTVAPTSRLFRPSYSRSLSSLLLSFCHASHSAIPLSARRFRLVWELWWGELADGTPYLAIPFLVVVKYLASVIVHVALKSKPIASALEAITVDFHQPGRSGIRYQLVVVGVADSLGVLNLLHAAACCCLRYRYHVCSS